MTAINTTYVNMMDRYQNLISDGAKSPGLGGLDQADPTGQSFTDMLTSELDKVTESQKESDNLMVDFVSGGDVDLHQVMIAAEEARLNMEMMVQVRNKVIEAYKELNNMQL